jgi:hypothetical protein
MQVRPASATTSRLFLSYQSGWRLTIWPSATLRRAQINLCAEVCIQLATTMYRWTSILMHVRLTEWFGSSITVILDVRWSWTRKVHQQKTGAWRWRKLTTSAGAREPFPCEATVRNVHAAQFPHMTCECELRTCEAWWKVPFWDFEVGECADYMRRGSLQISWSATLFI